MRSKASQISLEIPLYTETFIMVIQPVNINPCFLGVFYTITKTWLNKLSMPLIDNIMFDYLQDAHSIWRPLWWKRENPFPQRMNLMIASVLKQNLKRKQSKLVTDVSE